MGSKPQARVRRADTRKDGVNLGLLQRIFGTGSANKPETVADVEAKLATLRSERDQARAAIASLAEERRELLRVDGTDAKIEAAERKKRDAELVLERLELAEPQLVEALKAAQSRARAATWKKIEADYFAAADEFLATAKQARASYERVAAILKEAHAASFATEATHLLAVPQANLAPDIIAIFDRAVDAAKRRVNAPPPEPVKPRPHVEPADVTIRFTKTSPILAGQPAPRIGEVRTVRHDYAQRWLNAGAAERVREGTPSKPIAAPLDLNVFNGA